MYQQATGTGGVNFALQAANNPPSRLDAELNLYTSNAAAAVEGQIVNLSSMSPTAFTNSGSTLPAAPVATGTPYNAYIDGVMQVAASSTNPPPSLTISAYTGNAADAVTIMAGSQCYEQ